MCRGRRYGRVKFAIISDIHGNYPALVKVVEDAKRNNVDRFIFIGDYIFDLPFSNDVVRYISELEHADVILGNKETYLDGLSGEDQSGWVFEQVGALHQTYRELSGSAVRYLSSLREEAYIPLASGQRIYACHYLKGMPQHAKKDCGSSNFRKRMLACPFTHEQYLDDFRTRINQEDDKRLYHEIDASVILMGHNHLQGFGYCGDKLVINPGSCGQPLDFDNRAAYTILEETPSGFHVTEKRVAYDIDATIETARKSRIYACGTIWCELVFVAMRTGRDHFGEFFEKAAEIASCKGEQDRFFSNETWRQTYHAFDCFRGMA